ncbi:MAG: hypothetical protein Q9222_000500 [Ikaeria aurantiellina]
MTRETILLEKHEDLKRCIQARNSLLLELYRSTAVLSSIKNHALVASDSPNIDRAGEESFLQANDILLDRYFQTSTLPPLSPPLSPKKSHGLVPVQDERNHAKAIKTAAESSAPRNMVDDESLSQGRSEIDASLLSTSKQASQAEPTAPSQSIQASRSTAEQSTMPSSTTQDARETLNDSSLADATETTLHPDLEVSRVVKPADTIPLSVDDLGHLPHKVVKVVEAETRPGGPRTIHLPPKDEQEARLEETDNKSSFHPHGSTEESGSSETRIHNPSLDRETYGNNLQDREEIRDVSSGSQTSNHDSSRQQSRDVLGSQLDPVPPGAGVSTSSITPDEQLRLEEAQSMQDRIHSTDKTSPQPTPDAVIPKDSFSQATEANEGEPLHQSPDFSLESLRPFGHEQRRIDSASQAASALRNNAYPATAGEMAKDITFSQRPPMRIDTGLSQAADLPGASRVRRSVEHNAPVTQTPPDSAASVKAGQGSASAQSPPERMTTRVSSGALRHRPVSEILGETRKPVTSPSDKSSHERKASEIHRDALSSKSLRFPFSTSPPDPNTFRMRLNELKSQDKNKLSTVVFARKQPSQSSRHPDDVHSQVTEASEAKTKNTEYFLPLFTAQAATLPRSQLLNRLVATASKTLTTANHYVDVHEQQDCRILSKILSLQNANRWSFRQLNRSAEPERPTVHWDVLLGQAKWLRTDFREERKWKVAAAGSLAAWCAHWVASSKDERIALQVKARSRSSDRVIAAESAPTPDLVPSAEDDSSDAADDDVFHMDVFPGSAPAAIFSVAPEMFYFGLEKTPITENLLQELPLYEPSIEVQQAALDQRNARSDLEWKAPLLPISKFNQGKLISRNEEPPRKKSRYNYVDLDVDEDLLSASTDELESYDKTLAPRPAQDDVALFNPDNKHIRDRIHAGHAFRPPSEHVMPSQSFFESRHSSQWTQAEDDELRRLVRDYAYNWSLISSCLSVPSIFSSGPERRTPWECFERWIGLEGLPAEMAKTQYFRAYHARLQAAQSTHEAQQQAIQQQQGSNAPHLPLRRRSTQPFLVERRKNTKHVHLVNAIRNLAKKREASAKKQEEVAELAAIRKATQPPPARANLQTPQQWSQMKHTRDLKMQEHARAYKMHALQQQKVYAAQRAGLQPGQHPNGTILAQPGPSAVQAIANGNNSTNLPAGGQIQPSGGSQPRPPQMPRPSNGITSNGNFPSNQQSVPHAPMQPMHMPGNGRPPPPMGADNLRVYQEANRVHVEQQRYLLQQQRQQQHSSQMSDQVSPNGSHPNFPTSNGSSGHSNFSRRSGSPSMNGGPTPNGTSSSPRTTNPSQPQALSSGMMPTINQIMSQLRARNPNATPEQISLMATDRLKQFHSHAHAAMQAAAGGSAGTGMMNSNVNGNLQAPSQQPPPTAIMNGSPLTNTQQYANMIRNQQQHQQNRNSVTPFSGPRPSSRGATPQIHRTPSAQGGHPSASPVPSQAQIVGGQ